MKTTKPEAARLQNLLYVKKWLLYGPINLKIASNPFLSPLSYFYFFPIFTEKTVPTRKPKEFVCLLFTAIKLNVKSKSLSSSIPFSYKVHGPKVTAYLTDKR